MRRPLPIAGRMNRRSCLPAGNGQNFAVIIEAVWNKLKGSATGDT